MQRLIDHLKAYLPLEVCHSHKLLCFSSDLGSAQLLTVRQATLVGEASGCFVVGLLRSSEDGEMILEDSTSSVVCEVSVCVYV